MNYEQIYKAIDKLPAQLRWGITFALATVVLVLYYILFRIPADEELTGKQASLKKIQKCDITFESHSVRTAKT